MNNSCDLLLKARYCVTQDANRRIIENAAIAINDGQILALGTNADLQHWQALEIRDMGNALIMPGLVNAHTHAAMTFLRGLGDDMPLMEWLEQRIFPVEARLTAEITYTASLMAFAEMLASGTVACLDMYYFTQQIFKAATTAGIRCTAGETVIGFPNAACKTWHNALAVMEQLLEEMPSTGRNSLVVNPHSVYTTEPETLMACRDFACKHKLPMHFHLSETEEETARCLAAHGQRPVAYCEELGLLDLPVSLAHVVDVTDTELDLLASKKNIAVVHNPSSNMKLATGIAPIPAMVQRGIPVCLGTDGAASNNSLNIFAEIRQCALLHKVAQKDPTTLPAQCVLDMATCDGVRALNNASLSGSLEAGAVADLTVLDISAPHMQPMYSPVSHLTYVATGAEVVLTMVAGEILYDHGSFTRFDYPSLCEEMQNLQAYTRTLVA